jgi:hypothetical protein
MDGNIQGIRFTRTTLEAEKRIFICWLIFNIPHLIYNLFLLIPSIKNGTANTNCLIESGNNHNSKKGEKIA